MADSSSAGGSSGAGVLTYWKELNLPNLQKELDEIATDLANRQDESDASRKKLVEQSKDFKKNASEEVRKGATQLLKSFQGEVDSLSKRSKAAEAAFLDLYKKIIETPDPTAVLETAVQWQKKAQRVSDLEIENANFRETLDQYNTEFAEVKNQEVTIRQLREKVKSFEDHIEQEVQDKVKEKEANLQRYFQERERQLQEAGGILSLKLQEAERRSEALQSSLSAAQQELYSLRARSDDSRDARATEVEMIVADLERANQRAEAAEREAQALKEELESVESNDKQKAEANEANSKEDFGRQLQAMETELTSKDKQIRQLLEEVKQMNIRLAESSANFEEEGKKIRKELLDKSRALEILESKLSNQADYEEIKKELSVMKSIEFGSGEPEVSEGGKSLEVLLLEKNKALQAEKTALSVAQNQQAEELKRIQEEYKSAVSTVQYQKQLIENLEQDLLRVNSLQRHEAEGAADPSETPTEQISDVIYDKTELAKSGAADSLLPIVASQRERFRQRVQEVEEQNLQYQEHMALLQTEIEKMRTDNVKLFEKIKFLQSYSSSRGGQTAIPTDDTVAKYSSEYEASLDPFRKFNMEEKTRKYMALRTHDKATLGISRAIMGSSSARAFFFFYFIFLHCLVFMVLYKLAYTESCKRDFASDCVDKFREHMEQVHGNGGTRGHSHPGAG